MWFTIFRFSMYLFVPVTAEWREMLSGWHSNSSPTSKWRQIIRHRNTRDARPSCLRRSRRPEMTSATTVTWPSLGTVPTVLGTAVSNNRCRWALDYYR